MRVLMDYNQIVGEEAMKTQISKYFFQNKCVNNAEKVVKVDENQHRELAKIFKIN